MCDSGTFTTILNKHRRFIIVVVVVIILQYMVVWCFVHLNVFFLILAQIKLRYFVALFLNVHDE